MMSNRLFMALAAATWIAAADAQPQAPEPLASGWIMGGYVTPRHKAEKQSYDTQLHLVVPGNPSTPGASVAFGVTESGQVQWMGQTDYQPTLGLANVKRPFATPKPPLTVEQVPRFVMVCAWALTDDRKPAGKPVVGFAERDDSRTSITRDRRLQEGITLHWVSVPSVRVRDKFGKAIDLCTEVARTKKSSAPHWLLDRNDTTP